MLPMRITKVAPMVRTSGIEAVLRRRRKFETVRKFGLKKLTKMHKATSTATGAQSRQ